MLTFIVFSHDSKTCVVIPILILLNSAINLTSIWQLTFSPLNWKTFPFILALNEALGFVGELKIWTFLSMTFFLLSWCFLVLLLGFFVVFGGFFVNT